MLRLLRHSYGVFDRARSIGPACWSHHDLFFVHRGKVTLSFPALDRELMLERGRGVLIWPETKFTGRVESKQARASIQHFFVSSWNGSALDRCVAQKNGFSAQQASPSRELDRDVDRAIRLGRQGSSDRGELRMALLILILIEGGFFGPAMVAEAPRRIDQPALSSWLQSQIARNPGVPELARKVGLSPSRFRTLFLAEQGRTAGEFLREFRENEARRLLTETRQTLKEISATLGYADAVAFHRSFTHRVGLTPGRFRRKNFVSG